MMLGAIVTLMTIVAVAALAWPLLRKRPPAAPRADYERAVLADQMAEIERDVERGVIDEAQAEAARAEIGRRALARLDGAEATSTRPAAPVKPHRWAITTVIVLPVIAGGMYIALGRPDLPAQPFAGRPQPPAVAEMPSAETLATVGAMIAARVREAPTEVEGWRLMARLYGRIGKPDETARIYKDVIGAATDPARRAAIALAYGEAIMLAGDGTVTADARAAIATALEAQPDNPAARYYHGLSQVQMGDPKGALETWTRLRADTPADAPWRQRLDDDIERLKREQGVGTTTPGP